MSKVYDLQILWNSGEFWTCFQCPSDDEILMSFRRHVFNLPITLTCFIVQRCQPNSTYFKLWYNVVCLPGRFRVNITARVYECISWSFSCSIDRHFLINSRVQCSLTFATLFSSIGNTNSKGCFIQIPSNSGCVTAVDSRKTS